MRKWSVAKLNKETAEAISQKYSLPMLISMILSIRGIEKENDIEDFLFKEDAIEDPFIIKDMDKAVDRIKTAIENFERICIYGDFDADGVTSTALLYSYLSDIGADVMYYIPSREDEGYGMNIPAVDTLANAGVKLIITVDNGIAAVDEIAYANSLGIDTVVTDHHIPPEVLPDAVAVVDPHRDDCESSFKELSGVGVAFKLVMAIEGEYGDTMSLLENYADLVALGTIGDVVPLVSENRIFVKHGLYHISNSDRLGICALIEESGLSSRRLSAGSISFTVVPRINAGGRLGLSKKTVSMLVSDDEDYVYEVASELSNDNINRQAIEKEILDDIDEMVKCDPSIVQNSIIVVVGENWHQGVIGIVASRLKEIYNKPAIVISKEGEECRASGRSVKGFSLSDAVFSCGDLLLRFGGHPMAVGFGIKEENIDAFIKKVNDYCKNTKVPLPTLELDCKLNPSQLSVSLASSLEMLEPYGAGNPTVLFGLYNMTIKEIKELSGGKHLKFILNRGDTVVTALKFSTTLSECPYKVSDTVDLAVTLDVNEYNNTQSLCINIKDMKFSNFDIDSAIESKEIFESFCRGDLLSKEELISITPTRDEFATVYRFLRANDGYNNSVESLLYRLESNLSFGKLRVILEAMNELSLIRIFEGLHKNKIELCKVEGKVNLDDSVIINKLKEGIE